MSFSSTLDSPLTPTVPCATAQIGFAQRNQRDSIGPEMLHATQTPSAAVPNRHVAQFTEASIDGHLNKALKKLTTHDNALFNNDVNERSLSFRLALYLVGEFPDFDVDCEYNRHHNEDDHCKRLRDPGLKALAKPRKDPLSDDEGLTVYPDIIIHRRGTDHNLLVLEIKKTSSSINSKFDIAKLKSYRKELKYRFAKFIRLGTKGEADLVCENLFVENAVES
ncbi:MAG: hypothetical protein IT581_11045 [Verrucomicrobiales bacterium]|nr:hypothetical protein [Verrucomicrobiales bacterium]